MPNPTTDIDYDKFAQYTVERWQERIPKAGIHGSGELLRSFAHHVSLDANGDLQKIVYTFHVPSPPPKTPEKTSTSSPTGNTASTADPSTGTTRSGTASSASCSTSWPSNWARRRWRR